MPEFAWRDWDKTRKSSGRVLDVLAEVRNEHLQHTSQKRNYPIQLARFGFKWSRLSVSSSSFSGRNVCMKEQQAWTQAREALTIHRPRVDSHGRVGVSGAVLGTAGYRGGGAMEMLLLGATDCSTTIHRLKTSSISSSVKWATALRECFQDG